MIEHIILFILTALGLASQSQALDFETARDLATRGALTELAGAFEAHQEAMNAGTLSPKDFTAPYTVFSTTDPTVERLIEDWLARSPASAQAMTARLIQ